MKLPGKIIVIEYNDNSFHSFHKRIGFKSNQSTESAPINVLNDIYVSRDFRVSVLVILDVIATLDTIDHNIMLDRVEKWL